MVINANSSSDFHEDQYSFELLISRYKNLARELFKGQINYDKTSTEIVEEITRNYSVNLPTEINEYAIIIDHVPLFWLSDLGLIHRLEADLKKRNLFRHEGTSSLKEIKKFYSKWILQKNEKERNFFAMSTINLIERNPNKNNFIKHIILSVILSFDKRIFKPEKAIESLQKAKGVLENLDIDPNIKTEFLYIIQYHIGFVFFKKRDFETAKAYFNNAITLKPSGVTALIYLAISEKETGKDDAAVEIFNKIVELDLKRYEFAINVDNLNLFSFFLNTSYVYAVFQEMHFADMATSLEFVLDSFNTNERNYIEKLSAWVDKLDELRIKEYYTEKVKKELDFIESFDNRYRNSSNVLILMVGNLMIEKFHQLTENILEGVRRKHLVKVQAELFIYDKQAEDAKEAMKSLEKSSGSRKEALRKKGEEEIKIITALYDERLEYMEKQFEFIDKNNKFDPGKAFSTAMFYNLIIAAMIFVIGGFGGQMMGSENAQLGEIFGDFFVNGIKWGGITFVLGFFVSLFTAASTITEKSSEKRKMRLRIDNYKKEKERVINNLKKENEKKLKMFDANFSDELHREESRLTKVVEEKKHKFSVMNSDVEAEVEKVKLKLNSIFE